MLGWYSQRIANEDDRIGDREEDWQPQGSRPLPTKVFDLYYQEIVTTHGDVGEYAAVSYVWGQWQDRDSLLRAVKLAADAVGCRYVWVDQWCINQQDAAERAREVKRMREYYKNGNSTIVLIPEITGEIFSIKDVEDSSWRLCEWQNCMETLIGFVQTSQWSTRVWTLQEGMLGQAPILCNGSQVITTHELRAYNELKSWLQQGAKLIKASEELILQRVNTWAEADSIAEMSTFIHGGILNLPLNYQSPTGTRCFSPPSFETVTEVWQASKHRKCSEVEDLVYGALALVEGWDPKRMEIKYGIGYEGAVLEAARAGLIGRDIVVGEQNSGSGPSWIGRWDDLATFPDTGCKKGSKLPVEVDDNDIIQLPGTEVLLEYRGGREVFVPKTNTRDRNLYVVRHPRAGETQPDGNNTFLYVDVSNSPNDPGLLLEVTPRPRRRYYYRYYERVRGWGADLQGDCDENGDRYQMEGEDSRSIG